MYCPVNILKMESNIPEMNTLEKTKYVTVDFEEANWKSMLEISIFCTVRFIVF